MPVLSVIDTNVGDIQYDIKRKDFGKAPTVSLPMSTSSERGTKQAHVKTAVKQKYPEDRSSSGAVTVGNTEVTRPSIEVPTVQEEGAGNEVYFCYALDVSFSLSKAYCL